MSRELQIGHDRSSGDDFFDRMLARLAEPGVFALLSRLFPERMGLIESQRCLSELQAMLNRSETAEAIHDFLVENQLVIQDWSAVLTLLEDAGLDLRKILADVLPVLQPVEAQLHFFHAIWKPDDENATLTVAEAELLFALLEKDSFDAQELPQLQALCESVMRSRRSVQYACCLYLIYSRLNLEDLAEVRWCTC